MAPEVIESRRPDEPVLGAADRLPRWVRVADVVSVAIAVIAAIVAATGGFRMRFGEYRVGLTSPYRPLLLATAIAVIRHLAVRDPSIYGHVVLGGRRWARAIAVREAAAVFLGSRPAILVVGLLAVLTIGYPPGAPPWRDYDSELFNLPLRWDAGWYLQIAENGYHYIPEAGALAQQNIVFFPAYPMVTRAVGLVLGNHKASYVAAAMLVSLSAFWLALTYLYAFARDAVGDERAAVTLWLIATYPFALFFGAIYTESLYLLAAIGAFHHFRRGQFARAGVWAVITGLTRPNGGLLTVPMALLAIGPWLPPAIAGGAVAAVSPGGRSTRRVVQGCAAAAMCAMGTLLYSAWVWRITGSPFAWASGHAAWGRHYTSLTQLAASRYNLIGHAGLYEYVARMPYDMLNGLGAFFVLTAVWPVWRRFGIAFAAFILINILPALTTGGFLSAGRLSSVLFPAFVWLADAIPARQRTAWIVTFGMLQALNASLFYTWRPLF